MDFSKLIVNPDLATGNANGWTMEFEAVSNLGYQSNKEYSNEGVTLSQFIEGWRSGNNPIGDGTIEQTIAYLPAGTYVLSADLIANLQGADAAATKGFYLFATEVDGEKSAVAVATEDGKPQHFEVAFKKASEDSKVTIGIEALSATGNWLAADNFKLYYYGTNSAIEVNGDASSSTDIEGVDSSAAVTPVAIYTISGVKVDAMQKGLNIVKFSDGSTKKILK